MSDRRKSIYELTARMVLGDSCPVTPCFELQSLRSSAVHPNRDTNWKETLKADVMASRRLK